MIRSGELDTRIRLEAPGTTRDEAGGVVSGWDLVGECWASVARTPGSEVWSSGARNARVPTVFRLRYRDDVTPDMRVVWGVRVFDIRSVVAQGARAAEMQLVCEEHVGEAA